jgi:hypothetical protein
MDVDGDLGLWERLQLVVAERQRLLDLAEDVEVPGSEVGLRNRAGVQHRPLLREVLARRQPGGIESLVDELLLGLRSEERHANLD